MRLIPIAPINGGTTRGTSNKYLMRFFPKNSYLAITNAKKTPIIAERKVNVKKIAR